jgi:hypothetical protein
MKRRAEQCGNKAPDWPVFQKRVTENLRQQVGRQHSSFEIADRNCIRNSLCGAWPAGFKDELQPEGDSDRRKVTGNSGVSYPVSNEL